MSKKYGIDINPDDGDPDDEYDMGGSLEVNRVKIDELKKLKRNIINFQDQSLLYLQNQLI